MPRRGRQRLALVRGEAAAARIYAVPAYGCWMDDYPLHMALAIYVPLRDLGTYPLDSQLERILDA